MSKEFEGDAGAPLPDFGIARNISLDTVAPALGVQSKHAQPDYLDYEKSRGMVTTMFANTGLSYVLGISAGGLFGLQKGITSTPSSKLKVQVNSVLNHCGRHGSKFGNTFGVFAVVYSLYEGIGDKVSRCSSFISDKKKKCEKTADTSFFTLVGIGTIYRNRLSDSSSGSSNDRNDVLCSFRNKGCSSRWSVGPWSCRSNLCWIYRYGKAIWKQRIFILLVQSSKVPHKKAASRIQR